MASISARTSEASSAAAADSSCGQATVSAAGTADNKLDTTPQVDWGERLLPAQDAAAESACPAIGRVFSTVKVGNEETARQLPAAVLAETADSAEAPNRLKMMEDVSEEPVGNLNQGDRALERPGAAVGGDPAPQMGSAGLQKACSNSASQTVERLEDEQSGPHFAQLDEMDPAQGECLGALKTCLGLWASEKAPV